MATFAQYSNQTGPDGGANRERVGTMHGKLEPEQTAVSEVFREVKWREEVAQTKRMRELRVSWLITAWSFVLLTGTLAAVAMHSVVRVLF